MTFEHQNPETRAAELSLRARHGDLSTEEASELAQLLAAHPHVASEVAQTDALLERIGAARVAPGPEFFRTLERRIGQEALSDRRRSSRRGRLQTQGFWSSALAFLLGRDGSSVSGQTLAFARVAAVYVGVAAVLLPWLILAEPSDPVRRPSASDAAVLWIPADHETPEFDEVLSPTRPR